VNFCRTRPDESRFGFKVPHQNPSIDRFPFSSNNNFYRISWPASYLRLSTAVESFGSSEDPTQANIQSDLLDLTTIQQLPTFK
jgi:hypothetical protein